VVVTSITLFALGVGLNMILDEMATKASEPDVSHIFWTVTFAALQHNVEQVTDRTCNGTYTFPPMNSYTSSAHVEYSVKERFIVVHKSMTSFCKKM